MSAGHTEESGLDALYRDVLFEHYRNPHNKGALATCEIVTKGNNPVCGDKVTIYGKLATDGKTLERISFEGKACAICTASTSMMTDVMTGKTLEDAEAWADKFKGMMRDEVAFETPETVPDMEALEGVKKFPVRVKCATLGWTTLKNGILAYRAGLKDAETNTEESCAT